MRTLPRTALLVLLAGLAGAALGQRPINVPNYFLSTAPRLEPGLSLDGELTSDDGQNFKDGSYLDVFTFSGRSGDLEQLTVTSFVFDTVLTVFGPDGTLIEMNDDDPNGFGTDSGLRLRLPLDGRYAVVVSGYSPADLGAYTVTRELLARADDVSGDIITGGVLELPALVTGRLDFVSSMQEGYFQQHYTFELEQPLLVLIQLRSQEFDAYVQLYDDEGFYLGENDDGSLPNPTDSQLAMPLEPGSYEVVVSSFNEGETGAFELQIDLYAPLGE